MKHRLTALALAGVLSLSLLAGCGGSPDPTPEASTAPTESVEPTATPEATPDVTPEVTPTAPAVTPEPSETTEPSQAPEAELTLSHSDVTLKTAGSTFRLRAVLSGALEGESVTYASENEAVATVDEKGNVTAVAPGTVTITVSAGGQEAGCIVRCNWKEAEATPEPTPAPTEPPASSTDLAAFYEDVKGSHEGISVLSPVDDETLLEGYFPGLSAISTQQRLIYMTMMTMNTNELVLVQVTNSGDVDPVKSILQARIDSMAEGGAWYPGAIEAWANNSRVVSNGNYVMMVVNDDCDAIVDAFNALF